MANKSLVSKCLIGGKCRWDGKKKNHSGLEGIARSDLIPVCPEMDGGLLCPRPPAGIDFGDGFDVLDGKSRVFDIEGRDVTDNYIRGAQKALNAALGAGVNSAYLKDKSPSCGVNVIYRGKDKAAGTGVTAALLKRHGIKLESME